MTDPNRQRFRTFMFPGRKILPGQPRWQQALVSAGVWLLVIAFVYGGVRWAF